MSYTILNLREHVHLHPRAAQWFHEKWGVPLAAYEESMAACAGREGVPQWYIAADESGAIVGGLGVIENDFHKRPDLTPNICAVYVEEAARGQGLARRLMDHACEEMARMGKQNVYLITTHTELYEHLDFSFLCMVEEDDGGMVRMYHRALG